MSCEIKWKETAVKKKSELTRGEQIQANLRSEEYRKFLFNNPDLFARPVREPQRIEFRETKHLCWHCNDEVVVATSRPRLRVYCDECKEGSEKEKQETLKKYVELKIRVMYERALKTLEKQGSIMAWYKEPAEAVLEKALAEPEKFSSSQEMIAVMELLRNEVKVVLQKRVGNYVIDMVLPDLFIGLEIDGYMHQYKRVHDNKRDVAIRAVLGEKWEIIRIPTHYVDENAGRLLRAANSIYKYKQKIRGENGGLIPAWFSTREHEHYKELFGKLKNIK